MKAAAAIRARARAFCWVAVLSALCLFCPRPHAVADGPAPQVEMDVSGAGPRSVESLTEGSIIRDYGQAWSSLAAALEYNRPDFLDRSFVGPARSEFAAAIADQETTGVRVQYRERRHHLKAVFYAPEGDLMELHDTLECELQVTDGLKVIHQEHAVLYYVVLITPGADRWVIQRMQAVAQF